MLKKYRSINFIITLLIIIATISGCSVDTHQDNLKENINHTIVVEENSEYQSKIEVAEYIHIYKKLPSNYITTNEAKKMGWPDEGTLDKILPGKSIGGDKFGNYENKLPQVSGRVYRECDIDYNGGKRNAKRIVYSNDGNIYYTEDHYNSFEHLYGDD